MYHTLLKIFDIKIICYRFLGSPGAKHSLFGWINLIIGHSN